MSDRFQKIKEVENFLESIPKFSSSGKSAAIFDLKRMRKFCNHIGNPEKNFKSIHVAGTNGKGTVCRILASIYQEAGFKTGLYTSPHLLDIRERFRINSQMIENELFLEFFNMYHAYIREQGFTYFEITTAIAFWYFSKRSVDIAVLETGLGGRLDATNVISPIICAITSIGLDHTDILGDSIRDIAFEKAGIIKTGVPVVVGHLPEDAMHVIQSVAESKNAELLKIDVLEPISGYQRFTIGEMSVSVNLDPTTWKSIDHYNVAIVSKIAETLASEFPVKTNEFTLGLKNVHSRFAHNAVFQKLSEDKLWYFDGAHNEESVKTLTEHLLSMAPAGNWSVVLSFMGDKLNQKIADIWNKFPNIYIYEMEGSRAASIKEMKEYFPAARVIRNSTFLQSNQFKSELVIFSGSFYFYSVVSNWMGAIASAD